MSIFPISSIKPVVPENLTQGVYLWITHADKIPPHIGISVDGNYFSLKVNGKDDKDIALIYRTISQKKIPSLFVQLDENHLDKNRFLTVKSTFVSVNQEVKTCLFPILNFLDLSSHSFLLVDLLKYLEENQIIIQYFALNLPTDFQGIKKYALEDVTNHLKKIKDAERPKHIS